MVKQGNFVDRMFFRYYLIIYYLYMMSVNVFFPKGGPVGYVVNGILLLFILYASVVRNKYNSKFILVYLYLLFTLLLVIFQSSNLLYSITNYIKYTMGLLCLPIGFNLLSSVRKLKEFQNYLSVC